MHIIRIHSALSVHLHTRWKLAFAAVYRERDVLCGLLWGVGPHDIPNGEQWGSRMQEHGPPPPDRRVGCTGPGRAGGVRVGACGRIGDWKTSLRAKQPRRGGSQLWCSADARAESRGLSKPRCKRCLPGSPRSGEDELRGSCVFKVLPGRCYHCQSRWRAPERPVRNVWPGGCVGLGRLWPSGRADPS